MGLFYFSCLAVNHSGDAGGDGVVVAQRRAVGTGRRGHRVKGSEGAHHPGSCGRRGVVRPAVASGGRIGIVATAVGRIGWSAWSTSRWSVKSRHGTGTE